MPGGDTHRYAQWPALAFDLDLDSVQPAERSASDYLAPPLVGSGEHHQQLALGGMADTVEAAQLAPERGAEVGQRLRRKLLAVGLCEMLDVVKADEQAAQRGVMTPGPVDLLVQACRQLRRG